MVNPTLHVNKVFREQVEKCLRSTFRQNTMKAVKSIMRKKDTSVIVIIMFYETKTNNPIKV